MDVTTQNKEKIISISLSDFSPYVDPRLLCDIRSHTGTYDAVHFNSPTNYNHLSTTVSWTFIHISLVTVNDLRTVLSDLRLSDRQCNSNGRMNAYMLFFHSLMLYYIVLYTRARPKLSWQRYLRV